MRGSIAAQRRSDTGTARPEGPTRIAAIPVRRATSCWLPLIR